MKIYLVEECETLEDQSESKSILGAWMNHRSASVVAAVDCPRYTSRYVVEAEFKDPELMHLWSPGDDTEPPKGSVWDVLFRSIAAYLKHSGLTGLRVQLVDGTKSLCHFAPKEPASFEAWDGLLSSVTYALECAGQDFLQFAIHENVGMAWTFDPAEVGVK